MSNFVLGESGVKLCFSGRPGGRPGVKLCGRPGVKLWPTRGQTLFWPTRGHGRPGVMADPGSWPTRGQTLFLVSGRPGVKLCFWFLPLGRVLGRRADPGSGRPGVKLCFWFLPLGRVFERPTRGQADPGSNFVFGFFRWVESSKSRADPGSNFVFGFFRGSSLGRPGVADPGSNFVFGFFRWVES